MSRNKIIVIGGGINGTSIAFHLAQEGAQVILLEKNEIAGGPSGVSSAIVRQHYSNPVTAKMALDSLHFWQNFENITGGEKVFTQTGFLIGVRPKDIQGLKSNIKLQQAIGINTTFVSTEELKELEPFIDLTGLGGAAYEPESGYCNPVESANGFAKAAKQMGAVIKTGIRALRLKTRKDKITGVETDNGFFPSEKVVLATGPWSNQLLDSIHIKIPSIVARVKVGIYKKPPSFKRHKIWGDFISQIYLRPETGGLLLVGSISPEEETHDIVPDPDIFNQKVEFDTLASFAERVAMRYPIMETGHLFNNYASLYDITPDWHHIIDQIPDIDGLYICAGTSGHGFKLAPAVGEMVAKLVLHGKNEQDPVNLFSFDRFAAGRLIHSSYEYSILG